MRKRRKVSLRIKFSLISVNLILAILIIVFSLVGFLLIRQNESFLADVLLKDTKRLLSYFSDTIYEGILFDDDLIIAKSFDNIKEMENIDYAVLFDGRRRVKVHSEVDSQQKFLAGKGQVLDKLFKEKKLTVTPPFDANNVLPSYMISKSFFDNRGRSLGLLLVEYSATEIKAKARATRGIVLRVLMLTGVISLGLAIVFALILANLIVKPIRTIVQGTQIIGGGKLDHVIDIDRNDEIGTLSDDFNLMTKKIKDTLDHLEDLVDERTKELQETLTEVKALKVKQDGDYFLTSLIVQPLIKNLCKSERVSIDFLLEQKTKFEFRRKQAEIGGDICIAETVEFRGNRYTIFTNADAMGKSVQGAGGVLIYGIVFQVLLRQLKEGIYGKEITPGKLMHTFFHELHKAFLPFDGKMLMSGIVGIINEKTGKVWYFNAEHPWLALYRKGEATYLEDKLELHKFGLSLNEMRMPITIKTYQMLPGDVLFLGSDGRDDLRLREVTDVLRQINEDDDQFLRRVEEGDGDLKRIYDGIVDFGDLTDDISLLRLEWK